MNRPLYIIPLILLSLLAASCCEKKIYCTSGALDFAFTGYQRTEVRSFTLRRFVEGNEFQEVLDSAQFIYYGTDDSPLKPDTFYFGDYRTVGDLKAIKPGNDWQIYLPAIQKTYYFSTIYDDQNNSQFVRCNDNETSCTKKITNFSINFNWQSGNFIYIPEDRF